MERNINILLIEDNKDNVILTQEAFADNERIHLHIVVNSIQAMDFLYKKNRYVNSPYPKLILLDLNLPGKSGFEILQNIKGDDELKSIPVIILSTSSDEKDVQKGYKLGANCYITKPIDFSEFCMAVKYIEKFWVTMVKLP